MPVLRVRDLVSLAHRDHVMNGRPYGRVFPSQMQPLLRELGDVDVLDIHFSAVEEYKLLRVSQGAARETVNKELSGLSKGFRLALEAALLASMPKIRRLAPGEPRSGFLTVTQFQLVAVELPPDVRDVCEWAYWSGWRRGECFELQWMETNDEWAWTRDKNGRAKYAPLSGPLGAVMARRRRRRRSGCPWVFHRKGRPIRCVRKAWNGACRRAGVDGRVFHDMRRSFCRNGIRAGIDRDTVMALSGHKTDAIFRRYNIQDERDLLLAAERLTSLNRRSRRRAPRKRAAPGRRSRSAPR